MAGALLACQETDILQQYIVASHTMHEEEKEKVRQVNSGQLSADQRNGPHYKDELPVSVIELSFSSFW